MVDNPFEPPPTTEGPDETFEQKYRRRGYVGLPPLAAGAWQARREPPFHWADPHPFEPRGGVIAADYSQGEPFIDAAGGHYLQAEDLRLRGEALQPELFPKGHVPARTEPPTAMGREAGIPAIDQRLRETAGNRWTHYAFKEDLPYNTELTPEEDTAYRQWAKSIGKNPALEEKDYDLRGYWKDVVHGNPRLPEKMQQQVQAIRAENAAGGTTHFTDRYKKPSHPTFSDQSIYHGPNLGGKVDEQGGTWDMKNKTFDPGLSNLAHHSPQELREYFRKYEPDWKLKLPPGVE